MCRLQGFDKVRRTAQYCGNTGDAADCIGLPNIHQEVKCVERLNVYGAYNQASHRWENQDRPSQALHDGNQVFPHT